MVEPLLLHLSLGCCLRVVPECHSVCVFVDVASVAEAVPHMIESTEPTDVELSTTVAFPRMERETLQMLGWAPTFFF